MKKELTTMEVKPREKALIEKVRNTAFGEIRIIVQDKEPIRIVELQKSIKL